MRPDESTPVGTTVVYDSPAVTAPVAERPRYTFLGVVPDDAEPGAYSWIAEHPAEGQEAPIVTSEITADLLIVGTVDLDEFQTGLLQSLVRQELRNTRKKRVGLIRQFGADADLSGKDEREELLRSCYAALGGDPERITDLPEKVEVDGPPPVHVVTPRADETLCERPSDTVQRFVWAAYVALPATEITCAVCRERLLRLAGHRS